MISVYLKEMMILRRNLKLSIICLCDMHSDIQDSRRKLKQSREVCSLEMNEEEH